MNETEFNEEFEKLIKTNMPAPIASISVFIRQCFKLTEEEMSDEDNSNVIQCASLLNLDCMAQFMGVQLENIPEEDLERLDPHVKIGEKKLYFSVHLLHKTMVVRSATVPKRYCGFVELDLKDFGLVAN